MLQNEFTYLLRRKHWHDIITTMHILYKYTAHRIFIHRNRYIIDSDLNATNNYLRLEFCAMFCIRHTKSESDLVLYNRNLRNECLKPVFVKKTSFYFEFTKVILQWKKRVWNARFKDFGYTNIIKLFTILTATIISLFFNKKFFLAYSWQNKSFWYGKTPQYIKLWRPLTPFMIKWSMTLKVI